MYRFINSGALLYFNGVILVNGQVAIIFTACDVSAVDCSIGLDTC